MNNFSSRDITIVKKKFEQEIEKTSTKCSHNSWATKVKKNRDYFCLLYIAFMQ